MLAFALSFLAILAFWIAYLIWKYWDDDDPDYDPIFH
jgi:hypothetical protein